jgi:transcriptional regulator
LTFTGALTAIVARAIFLSNVWGKRPHPHALTHRMTQRHTELLQGTLDLLILKALSLEPMHGWGVAQRIEQFSRGTLTVNQGSLYPALHRLEHRGWIRAEWGTSENNRRAKYYRLTATGRRQLAEETASWERFSAAVALVLRTT